MNFRELTNYSLSILLYSTENDSFHRAPEDNTKKNQT